MKSMNNLRHYALCTRYCGIETSLDAIMTIISKELFYEKITKDVQCSHIHFWHPNCTLSTLYVMKEMVFGVAAFYVPIYLAQLTLRYKRINKNYLKKTLRAYLRSLTYGFLYGTFFISSFCVFANIFGRLHYYCVGFGPGVCSALSIFVESKEMLNLNTLIYSTLVFETLLRLLEIRHVWNRSVLNETALFMSCSALLMFLMARRKTETFTHVWFYSPPQTNNSDVCSHQEKSCSKHCLNGASRYFVIGYAINLAKMIVGNIRRYSSSLSFKKMLSLILNRDNFLFAVFFGAYVGIFRSITCLLSNKYKKKRNWHTIVAGLLAGVTYAIKPNLQMICIALVTTFQLLCQNCFTKETVETFRLREILFIFCTGLLTHTLVAYQDICPKYYVNTFNTCTRGIILRAYDRIVTTVIKN